MLPLLSASIVVSGLALLFSNSRKPKFRVSVNSDCSEEFIAFVASISLNKTKKQQLRRARGALQKKIKDHFISKPGMTTPLFYIQGSVKHGTVIRNQDDICDVDVGVYFQGKPTITPASIQSNILKAVENHTSEKASKRQKCVRVYYASLFHIDLPIYYLEPKTSKYYLGVGKDWLPSDPKEFTDWCKSQIGNSQKRRLIMYFKAWANVVKKKKRQRMPSGLAFTIWVNTFFCKDDREDLAFIKTAYSLLQYLQKTKEKNWECLMPVAPYDNVLEKLSIEQRLNFQDALENLVVTSVTIFNSDSKDRCLEEWKHFLGKWFI
jgi:hypothetical protein